MVTLVYGVGTKTNILRINWQFHSCILTSAKGNTIVKNDIVNVCFDHI